MTVWTWNQPNEPLFKGDLFINHLSIRHQEACEKRKPLQTNFISVYDRQRPKSDKRQWTCKERKWSVPLSSQSPAGCCGLWVPGACSLHLALQLRASSGPSVSFQLLTFELTCLHASSTTLEFQAGLCLSFCVDLAEWLTFLEQESILSCVASYNLPFRHSLRPTCQMLQYIVISPDYWWISFFQL